MKQCKLTLAGCGDAFGSGGNLYSTYHLEMGGQKLLIDCGATAVPALKRSGLATDDLDMVIISHFHGDHYAGLPFLLLEAGIFRTGKKPLYLLSPGGLEDRIYKLFDLLYPGSRGALNNLDLRYIAYPADEPIQVNGITVLAKKVKHSRATLPHGIRLSCNGKVFAFSGDTGWTSALEALAEGADLFLCECNNYSTEMSSHLDLQTLRSKTELLRAKRIILTHFGREMIEAAEAGKTKDFTLASEGAAFAF